MSPRSGPQHRQRCRSAAADSRTHGARQRGRSLRRYLIIAPDVPNPNITRRNTCKPCGGMPDPLPNRSAPTPWFRADGTHGRAERRHADDRNGSHGRKARRDLAAVGVAVRTVRVSRKSVGARFLGRSLRLPGALDRKGTRWVLQAFSPATVIVLVHRGRKSGRVFKTPLEVTFDDRARGER